MIRTPIKQISAKQRKLNRQWVEIDHLRARQIAEIYEQPICEYCGWPDLYVTETVQGFGGHHINRNRKDNRIENCYLCHWSCHQHIHNYNLTVKQYDFQGAPEPYRKRLMEMLPEELRP